LIEVVREWGAEEDIWAKRGRVTGGWRKLHNEELHDLFFLPSINFCNISMYLSCVMHLPEDGHMSGRNM
jgi:hypothetical protein